MHQDSCLSTTITKQKRKQPCNHKMYPFLARFYFFWLGFFLIHLVLPSCVAVRLPKKTLTSHSNQPKQTTNIISYNQYQSVAGDGSTGFNTIKQDSSSAYDIRKLLEDYVTYLSSLSDYEDEKASSQPQQQKDSRMLQSRSVDQVSSLDSKRPLPTLSYQSTRNKFNYPTVLQNPQQNTIIVNTKPTLIATTAMPIGGSNNGPSGSSLATTKFILELPTESGLSLNLNDDELNSFIDNVLGTSTDSSKDLGNLTVLETEYSGNSSLLTNDDANTKYEDELNSEFETSTILPLSLKIVSNPINVFNTSTEQPVILESVNHTATSSTTMPPNRTESIESNISYYLNSSSIKFEDSEENNLEIIETTTTTTIAPTTTTTSVSEDDDDTDSDKIAPYSRAEIYENTNDENGNSSNNFGEEEFNELVSKEIDEYHGDDEEIVENNTEVDSGKNLLPNSTTTESSVVVVEINDNISSDNSIDNQSKNANQNQKRHSDSDNRINQLHSNQKNHDATELLDEMKKTKDLLRVQMDFLQNFNISLNNGFRNLKNNVSIDTRLFNITVTTAAPILINITESINEGITSTTSTLAPSAIDNSKYEAVLNGMSTEMPPQITTTMATTTNTTTTTTSSDNNLGNELLPETTTTTPAIADIVGSRIETTIQNSMETNPQIDPTTTQLPELAESSTITTPSSIPMETTTETKIVNNDNFKRKNVNEDNSKTLQTNSSTQSQTLEYRNRMELIATTTVSSLIQDTTERIIKQKIPSVSLIYSDLNRMNSFNNNNNSIATINEGIKELETKSSTAIENGTNLNISGPIPTANESFSAASVASFAAANDYRSTSSPLALPSHILQKAQQPEPASQLYHRSTFSDQIPTKLDQSETENLAPSALKNSETSSLSEIEEHKILESNESEDYFRNDNEHHELSSGSTFSFNNELNNYLNESNDGETMILTHVPKITIIHKIVKPSGSRNGSQTDEEVYRETLRKHKHLIKTAMNSISLYPAAFKRYKLNSNSKVNSVGEIYLLPNFARTLVNSHKLLQQPSESETPATVVDQQQQSNKKQFIQLLQRHLSKNQNKQVVIRQAPPHKKLKIKKISLDAAESIKSNDKRQMIVTADMADNLEPMDKTTVSNNFSNQYSKLNVDSPTAKPEFQNPENILKVYRPRTQQRKYKKIRIPSKGLRSAKKSDIQSNSTLTLNKDYLANDTNLDDKQPRASNRINSTPILFSSKDHYNEDNREDASEYTASPSITTTTTNTVTTTSATTTTEAPALTPKASLKQSKRTSHRKKINHNKHNSTATKSFKIFCTYDAHRTLSFPPKENFGQFFDIGQLEKNAAVLEQCTHLVYAFANINMNGEVFSAFPNIKDDRLRAESEESNHQNLVRIQHLKQRFPRLQVLVAIGGWNTPPQLFSLLVATSKLRDRLCHNIHNFVLNYDFDGAIISWFYPVYGSKPVSQDNTIGRSARSTSTAQSSLFQLDDKQNLVKLVRTLKARFDSIPNKQLEIGLISPPFEELIERGYDVSKLSEIVDHMILMTYDYYGSWQDKVHHFAPLYPSEADMLNERDQKFNINHTLNYWFNEQKAPRNKTIMGLAFYGRSFTLQNSSISGPGSPAIGPGIAGPITNKPGLLAFNELCDLYLGNQDVRLREDEHRITANLQLFDQWVGFDDELSLYLKTKYAIVNRLSGIFIWSINWDDYRNRCGWGRFPLLKAVNKAVEHCRISNNQCTAA